MSLLHRLLSLGCQVALLSPFNQAQIPSEPVASTANSCPGGWVGREEPKAVAWRAYDAMLTHDESAMSELLSLGSEWQPLSPQTPSDDGRWRHLSSEQEEERDAMTVVLDALIQLKAPVPGTALRNLAADFETAVSVWPAADNSAFKALEDHYRRTGNEAAAAAVAERVKQLKPRKPG